MTPPPPQNPLMCMTFESEQVYFIHLGLRSALKAYLQGGMFIVPHLL